MNRRENETLLRGLLAGAELDSLRHQSLDRGLNVARRRRGRRRLHAAGAMMLLPLLMATLPFWPGRDTQVGTSEISHPMPAPDRRSEVRLLNDEQLLALFPDQPVALVGKPGAQRLVFLDHWKQGKGAALPAGI